MAYTDKEIIELVKDALDEYNNGKLNAFTFIAIVNNVVNPHNVTQADVDWATKTIELLRDTGYDV